MRFIAGIVGVLFALLVVLLVCATLANGAEPTHPGGDLDGFDGWLFIGHTTEPMHPSELAAPPAIFTIDNSGVMHPKPLSAIMVSQCGGALALFIQVDANHLLRADPRQSDVFSNVDGKMEQSTIGPLEWGLAYSVAAQAVITTHVVVPCDSKEATT